MYSGGTRSGRVESTCPSLQKVGPSSSNAWRSRRAVSRVSEPSVSPLRRANSSAIPCFATTLAILAARPLSSSSSSSSSVDDRLRLASVERRRVHRDDGAVRGVGDAVGHVAEEELLVAAHAGVPDDDHVGALLGGDGDDRLGGLVVDDDPGPPARPGDLLGELVQLGPGDVEDVLVDAVGIVAPGRLVVVGGDDLDQEELGGEAVREVGCPLDGPLRRLGAIGGHEDSLHGRDATRPRVRRSPRGASMGLMERASSGGGYPAAAESDQD